MTPINAQKIHNEFFYESVMISGQCTAVPYSKVHKMIKEMDRLKFFIRCS